MSMSTKIVKKTAFDGHKNIVKGTPVDTGRARANWQIDLNGTNESTIESLSAPDDERDQLSQFKLGDTIHIFNNVEYILALEWGHSDQQPSGWVRSEKIRMQNKLQEAFNAMGKL